jgi:hypothetical protein
VVVVDFDLIVNGTIIAITINIAIVNPHVIATKLYFIFLREDPKEVFL